MRYTYLLLLFFTSNIRAQNLVPDGSFEEIKHYLYDKVLAPPGLCKGGMTWFSRATGSPWIENSNTIKVWYNDLEEMLSPKSGSQYIEMDMYGKKRSFLQVKLTQALIKDSTYTFSMFVKYDGKTKYIFSNLGVLLSDSLIPVKETNPIGIKPNVYYRSREYIPYNITDWLEITSSYKAKGGEQYLTISNFDKKVNLRKVKNNEYKGKFVYIYLDDISLIPKYKKNVRFY